MCLWIAKTRPPWSLPLNKKEKEKDKRKTCIWEISLVESCKHREHNPIETESSIILDIKLNKTKLLHIVSPGIWCLPIQCDGSVRLMRVGHAVEAKHGEKSESFTWTSSIVPIPMALPRRPYLLGLFPGTSNDCRGATQTERHKEREGERGRGKRPWTVMQQVVIKPNRAVIGLYNSTVKGALWKQNSSQMRSLWSHGWYGGLWGTREQD